MTAAGLLLALAVVFAALLRALRLLPGRARDQWHHAWLGLVAVGYLLARLPAGWPGCAGTALVAFCVVCLLDDAVKHSIQAWKYRRATTFAAQGEALQFECGLHWLAERVGLI